MDMIVERMQQGQQLTLSLKLLGNFLRTEMEQGECEAMFTAAVKDGKKRTQLWNRETSQ